MGSWGGVSGWYKRIQTILASDEPLYLGDPATDGTWRIVRSGNDLNFERRESGIWVMKGANLP